MNPITPELAATRQEHLFQLASFCQGLDATLRDSGLPSEQTFHTAVVAVCMNCGLVVSGDELFALSQPPNPERSTAKIGRLRKGDCARQGCEGYYYQIFLKANPPLDWPKVLAQVVARHRPKPEPSPSPDPPNPAGRRFARSVLCRIGLCALLVVALLLVRQWHQGGRIPFLREPEHFHVDKVTQEGIAE